jgi:hypothetical protein
MIYQKKKGILARHSAKEISTQTLAIMPMLEVSAVPEKIPIHEIESNAFNKELKISDFFVHQNDFKVDFGDYGFKNSPKMTMSTP